MNELITSCAGDPFRESRSEALIVNNSSLSMKSHENNFREAGTNCADYRFPRRSRSVHGRFAKAINRKPVRRGMSLMKPERTMAYEAPVSERLYAGRAA